MSGLAAMSVVWAANESTTYILTYVSKYVNLLELTDGLARVL